MSSERIRYRWVTGILVALSASNLAAAVVGDGGWLAQRRLEGSLTLLVEENHRQRVANRALAEGLDAFADDPETLEWLARTRLGYIRDGERVYRFEPEPSG